ncbi:sensor histidine kinase [Chondrinema litorale]|uniref:sensor histidine kinase n=1 Tax=Chondrinema litorale TaxID=2994555 RepID=UPI002542974E|nr:sensor histidine kinase [Chondrinema litorale]UZR97639.1 sensor histidine kinase [Chondrinema litorale]
MYTLYGQNAVSINNEIENLADITPSISLLADTSNSLDIIDVSKPQFQDNFIPFENFEKHDDANIVYWGKVKIENETDKLKRVLFAVNNNNFVRFYQSENDSTFSVEYAGELETKSNKDITGLRKDCTFNLYLLPKESKTIYYRVQSVTGFKPNIKAQLFYPKDWFDNYHFVLIKQSAFQGVLVIIITLCFLVFIGNKDRTYLYYALYVLSISIYFFWNFGFTSNYILPENPSVNNYIWTSFTLSPFFYFLFFRKFLETKKYSPKWDKVFKAFTYFSLGTFIFSITLQFITNKTIYSINITNVILFFELIAGIVFLNFIPKEVRLLKFAKIGNYALAIGGILSIIWHFLAFNEYALFGQLGVTFELIVFALGLGYKIRLNEEDKRDTQQELIVQLKKNKILQENINKELEHLVHKRTEELSEKNHQLEVQHDEISNQTIKLREANEEIQLINFSLEEIIAERTRELIYAREELNLFLYRTSHDLRGPLARIEGLLQILKLDNGDSFKDYWESFSKVTNSMSKTLESLLEISTIINHPSENQIIEIESLVDYLKKTFEYNINLISFEYPEELTFISKPTMLELAMKAIIQNALTYQHEVSEVLVKIDVSKDMELVVTISDNGIGIDEKILPNIFEMFFVGSTKSKGNGLGLFIAKKAVKELNGQIDVSSVKEQGTSMTLTIPVDASIKIRSHSIASEN